MKKTKPLEIDELKAIVNKKPKPPVKSSRDILENVEKNKQRWEEKEKLKLLEKLEAQILKKKPKPLSNTTNTSLMTTTNKSGTTHNNETHNSKRLIDNLTAMKTNNGEHPPGWKFDKRLLDDQEFRKSIRKEKIEIDCDKKQKEEDIDTEYVKNLSKDKLKFFLFKVRELYDFLNSIKLVRYIEIFLEDGFEDLESILEIEQDYFQERNYPDEHKIKILNKIKELRKLHGLETKQETPQVTKNQNEKEEEYDEELQAKLFKQAVEEFRTRKNSQSENKQQTSEIQIDTMNDLLPANKEKNCCWNCLKVILKEDAFEHYFEEKIIKLKVVIYYLI